MFGFAPRRTQMQLGMIGLGRMSANMAMRHMKAGHECMAELSATPPSHPPGEWPTSANERYLLQKLSLIRVAAVMSSASRSRMWRGMESPDWTYLVNGSGLGPSADGLLISLARPRGIEPLFSP